MRQASRSRCSSRCDGCRRIRGVLLLWAALAAAGSGRRALAELPEEVRVGALGTSGIRYEAPAPGTFHDLLGAAGDVDGDGRADFFLHYYDRDNGERSRLLLVWGRPDLPRELSIDTLDGSATIAHLFQGGAAPRAPFPHPGIDPTPDALDCVALVP